MFLLLGFQYESTVIISARGADMVGLSWRMASRAGADDRLFQFVMGPAQPGAHIGMTSFR